MKRKSLDARLSVGFILQALLNIYHNFLKARTYAILYDLYADE